MPQKLCKDCEYHIEVELDIANIPEGKGMCSFNPPSQPLFDNPVFGGYPLVNGNQRACGRYKQKGS